MRNRRNKNAPPMRDVPPEFVGSAYYPVKTVSDNISMLVTLSDLLNSIDLSSLLTAVDIDTLAKLNAVVTDATLVDKSYVARAEQGIPSGGTTGQVVAKSSNNDFEFNWVDAAAGNQGEPGPPGPKGKDGQIRFTGHGSPGTIIGASPDDTYLDLDSGNIYKLG